MPCVFLKVLNYSAKISDEKEPSIASALSFVFGCLFYNLLVTRKNNMEKDVVKTCSRFRLSFCFRNPAFNWAFFAGVRILSPAGVSCLEEKL